MPHRAPSPAHSPADPLLRHRYGGQLEAAAESFLITAFDAAAAPPALGEGGAVPPVLVSAAMSILTQSAWTQPTDEQVKASVYLGERALPAPSDARRAA